MDDFDYKKYSLEKLETWLNDALSSADATPQEIYDTIQKVVSENYYHYKYYASRAYELMEKLNGSVSFTSCNKDDKSPECQKAWNDFWEENYYPEETVDDGMRPWGHSDLEYGLANSLLTEDRISNFPGEQCVASKQDKVIKWQLPVELDGLTGDCFIQFPDDLLEAANLKENDMVEWIDLKNGSFELRKVNGTK